MVGRVETVVAVETVSTVVPVVAVVAVVAAVEESSDTWENSVTRGRKKQNIERDR
jgi:hypothetical protein